MWSAHLGVRTMLVTGDIFNAVFGIRNPAKVLNSLRFLHQ